jgi:hypothetical protein
MVKSSKSESKRKKTGKNEVHIHYHMDGKRPEETASGGKRKARSDNSDADDHGELHYHYYYEPPRQRFSRSSKPAIAGALLIIIAILGLIFSTMILAGGAFIGNVGVGSEVFGEDNTGEIYGQVKLNNGTPIENATVSIVGESIYTVTDQNGNYALYDIPTGNQKIRVEKDGYNTIIFKTFIAPSNNPWGGDDSTSDNEQNFFLSPGNTVDERGMYPPFGFLSGILLFCAVLGIIFSIIALLGGYYSLKRQKFSLAIVGAVVGIFTVGFLLGTLLAFVAIFILIISHDEFKANQ